MTAVSFGGTRHERLEIDVRRYERQPTGEYYDDNWLSVQITVAAGAFEGSFDAAFLTSELVAFRDQLQALHTTLRGTAELRTLEEQLSLDCVGNGLGSIELSGVAFDQPGIGNRLAFKLALDQTQVGAALAQLEVVVSEFPVRDV
jgi:hypothetical protein